MDNDERHLPPRKRARVSMEYRRRRRASEDEDEHEHEHEHERGGAATVEMEMEVTEQARMESAAVPAVADRFPEQERSRSEHREAQAFAFATADRPHFFQSFLAQSPLTRGLRAAFATPRIVANEDGPPGGRDGTPPVDMAVEHREEAMVNGAQALRDYPVAPVGHGEGGEHCETTATEESNTDDEDLQQLNMVMYDGGVLAGGEGALRSQCNVSSELSYEDVQHLIFHSAREQKAVVVERIFRIVRRSRNSDEVLRRLVQAEDDTGLTLLMIAVRHGMMNLCDMLTKDGADVNHNSEKRPYALLLAAQKGHEGATRFLLEHGANEESKNMALIPAAHFGHLEVVQLLLDFGADLNFSNKKGTTPLMRAAQEGRDAVVQFLIDKGVDACAANNEGMTALMLAAQRGHARIATILMKSGSDVNTQTRQGSTALLLAAKRGHTEAVEALLTEGADIYLKDDRHKTAAETAHRRGHVDLCLKITVSNQLSLMREGLRQERYADLMRLSYLYVLSRAEFVPTLIVPHRRQLHDLLDRTMLLPRPLLQNVALFLPLCRVWDRQLKYLIYETPLQPSRVVKQGLRILDEILLSVALEMRPSLHSVRRSSPHSGHGQLALVRDCHEFRSIFTRECHLPLSSEMLKKLRTMADLHGALVSYPSGAAIQFGVEVAQDVVSLLSDLLNWDAARKRVDLLV